MARLQVGGGAGACAAPVAPIEGACMNGGFLLLLLLFILLAAGPSWGMNTRFFFIIILAIIGLGGVGRTFGFSGDAV